MQPLKPYCELKQLHLMGFFKSYTPVKSWLLVWYCLGLRRVIPKTIQLPFIQLRVAITAVSEQGFRDPLLVHLWHKGAPAVDEWKFWK